MKTNKFWSIMIMLVLMLGTTIAFSSCSDDEDGDIGGIVGTWTCDHHYADGVDTYVFKSNGTYSWSYTGKLSMQFTPDSGKYTYDKKSGALLLVNKRGTTWAIRISSLTSTSLTWIDEDGWRYTYQRK